MGIVALIGVYVAENHNSNKQTPIVTSTSTNTNSNSSSQSATSPTLSQAVSQVNYVYANYVNDVLNGQVLQNKSQWATNNVSAAEDLQFIDGHKTWFTTAFISQAGNYESTNTSPPGGAFLMCVSGIAYLNSNSFVAKGLSESGTTAHLDLTYNVGGRQGQGPKINYTLPMTLRVSASKTWAIDSINLSSCSG